MHFRIAQIRVFTKISLFLLLLIAPITYGQENPDQIEEDTPLFSSVSKADHHLRTPLPIEKIRSAFFSDRNQGKIVWRIEKSRLPWRGSYSFLGKSDDGHPIVLLSVIDAHTGLKVAECQTPVSRTYHTGWREELDSNFHWHRVNWELNADALLCNTTADLKTIKSTIQSEDSEAFIVKISAAKGPRCIRNLYTDDEKMTDCPPKMRLHAFQAEHLKCGCPTTLSHDIEQEEPKVEIALEEPLNPQDSPLYNQIRRKPLSGHSQLPSTAEEVSVETGAPVFPMFEFTSSMEKQAIKTTETPDSSSVTTLSEAPTSHQQETEAQTETTPPASENNDQTSVPTPMSVEVTAQCDCQNNGTCVDSGKGKRECRCAEGFSGKQCERDLCKELGCQNNGKCIIRNGRAVCNCPRGLQGDKCHQIQEVDQQIVCNPKCENGGVCSLSTTGNPTCKCPHGFLGSNCNLRDRCAVNNTCEIYGENARCFKEVADLVKYSPTLQDSAYSCQCPTATGYIECNSTLTTRSSEMLTPLSNSREESVQSTPASQISTEDASSAQSLAPPSSEAAEFPMHSLGPRIQHVIGTRPDPPTTPQFPITSLSSVRSSEVASSSPFSNPTTIKILPRPTQRPKESVEASTAEFTRLPDLEIENTTPLTHVSTEEFERLTQVVEASTESAGVDHVGPKHSMEELQPEFHTVPTPLVTSTITTTLITLKNITNETPNIIADTSHSPSGGNWTWIIALAIVGVFLVGATIGGVFMGRYVRRSRRLHGKYNPAREENAAPPATYALPMTSTTVNKDERLI